MVKVNKKLNKSLRRHEYSSSSDDGNERHERQQSTQEISQRIDGEYHPTVPNLPGTSGVQPQLGEASPGTARNIQANVDGNLFWTIINNTPTSNNDIPHNPRPRLSDPSLASTLRPTTNHAQPPSSPRVEVRTPEQRTERQAVYVEVQRIITLNKVTCSLQNLAQSRTIVSRQPDRLAQRPATAVGVPWPVALSRPNLFTPTITYSRDGYNYRLPWRRSLPAYPTTNQVQSPVNWQYDAEPLQSNSGPSTSQMPPEAFGHITENSDDDQVQSPENWRCDAESVQSNNSASDGPSTSQMLPDAFGHVAEYSEDELQPLVPSAVQEVETGNGTMRHETIDNIEDENGEEAEATHTETVSGARLTEDVVEVDASEESDNYPLPQENEGHQENALPNLTKNVNASLLRLLECPVCLEWIQPPIPQCQLGHLVCSRCRARITDCPVCRTPFSSVRNRAMEELAEMLRYPCRHGCGRAVWLRTSRRHEAACGARRFPCPAPACARRPALPRHDLPHHFQCQHLSILKNGCKHKLSMTMNCEQHDSWLIVALDEHFHLRVDVDIDSWRLIVYVAYIGPKRNANSFAYEVTVIGQHNSRKLVYTRCTHSVIESYPVNVSRQDCFHLNLDQALNFVRFKNRYCEPYKRLDFDVKITKWEGFEESSEDSDFE